MIIKSKRLLLSPMSLDELRAKILSEPAEELQQAYREMLQGCLDHPGDENWYTDWQMLLPDGTAVGDLCFKGAPENGAVEIGYGVNETYRCMGYATEAVGQLCDWVFSLKGIYFVTAETEADNTASQRVLEKTGFKPTGETGEEGPLFELEKPAATNISIMMCIGMCLGVAYGSMFDNLAIGISFGMAIGVAIGAGIDSSDRKKRSALREARKKND